MEQGSLSVADYDRKHVKLSWYGEVIVASKSDICRRFKRGMRKEICTLVTTIAKWSDFLRLVETDLRV